MEFLTGRLDFLLRRVLWPLTIAGITYFACLIIFHDKRIAFGVAALPFVLGFIGAVVVSVTTPKQRADVAASGGNMMHGAVERMNSVVDSEAARANAMRANAHEGMRERHRRARDS